MANLVRFFIGGVTIVLIHEVSSFIVWQLAPIWDSTFYSTTEMHDRITFAIGAVVALVLFLYFMYRTRHSGQIDITTTIFGCTAVIWLIMALLNTNSILPAIN